MNYKIDMLKGDKGDKDKKKYNWVRVRRRGVVEGDGVVASDFG